MKNIIIIGAPRSGTNMLRDVLTSFDGFTSWPCDEINYIWRHGNIRYPSDELPVEKANLSVKSYIQDCFARIRTKSSSDVVVEKTCANSLRVPFVDTVVPDAKYIFIYRNGIDVTSSAKERWTGILDIPYLLEKVRFVPKADIPYYAVRYFWSRIYRFISREKRLAFWGPVLDDMSVILSENSLNEVCALQWQRCVDKAEEAFANMPAEKIVRVSYEDFVCHPVRELTRILMFIGKDIPHDRITKAVAAVSPRSLGKGQIALGDKEVEKIKGLVGGTLKRYGYS